MNKVRFGRYARGEGNALARRSAPLLLWAAFAIAAAVPSRAGDDADVLPLVRERVDEIAVVTIGGQHYRRVWFVRDGRVFAERLLCEEEMLWAVDGERFVLVWEDDHIALREVSAAHFCTMVLPCDPLARGGPWWAMWRNMRDLKLP